MDIAPLHSTDPSTHLPTLPPIDIPSAQPPHPAAATDSTSLDAFGHARTRAPAHTESSATYPAGPSPSPSPSNTASDDEDDNPLSDAEDTMSMSMYPASMVEREQRGRRNSYFGTVLMGAMNAGSEHGPEHPAHARELYFCCNCYIRILLMFRGFCCLGHSHAGIRHGSPRERGGRAHGKRARKEEGKLGRMTQSPSSTGTPAQGHARPGMGQRLGSDGGRQGQSLGHGGVAGGGQGGQQGAGQKDALGAGVGLSAGVGQIDAETGSLLCHFGRPGVEDPVSAGLIEESELGDLFDMVSGVTFVLWLFYGRWEGAGEFFSVFLCAFCTMVC